jgi:two-component system heavy metal sensor histidine kinase CusS
VLDRLTVRIALLVAAAGLAVLSVAGYALDRTLATRLERRDEAELRNIGKAAVKEANKLGQLRHVAGGHRLREDRRALEQDLLDAMVGQEGLAMTAYGPEGTVLVQSGRRLPPADAGSRPYGDEPVRAFTLDGTPWRLLGADLRTADTPSETLRIEVGRNGQLREALQAESRRNLAEIIALAAAAIALLGAWVVWSGLRPLREVTGAVGRITADRLDQRLVRPAHGAEVQELVDGFNRMLDRLDAGFEQLSRFSADLAHEFKTPLANLLMQSQVSLARPRSVADYQSLLASNIEEMERLSRMVENMLFLARADQSQTPARVEAFDAHAALERLAAYFEPLTDDKGLRIAIAGQATVHADADLFRRALGNVLANAVRHATPGTTIDVTVQASGADAVVIAVGNTGDAVSPDDLPHLFERFYRADRARQGAAGSSGLGLAIVRSVMDLHGGSAGARCEGDRFTVTLRFPAGAASRGPRAAERQMTEM